MQQKTIHLFDTIIMQIQNGRHNLTKVIISLLTIEIEIEILFHQTICFWYQRIQ